MAISEQIDQAKVKAKKIGKRILWISLIALIFCGIGYFAYRNYTVSEGTRTGILYKISKKGYVFKTYEGQLHLAGSAMMTEASTWNFSGANADVYSQCQQLEGKNVRCHYRQKQQAFPWQGETDYLVFKVEPVQ